VSVRLALVAGALVVACGGHPAREPSGVHPAAGARPEAPEPPPLRILVPAPSGLAWPLTLPPTLEPNYRHVHFPWPSVCDQRGVMPDDVLAYTEAWCAYAANGLFDLARALAPLRSSRVPMLHDAIVLDLANLAADGHGPDLVPWDAELQEVIIAIQIELGHLDDATETATSFLRYGRGAPQSCTADLLRWTFQFDPAAIDRLPEQVRRHGMSSCGAQFRKLACIIWRATERLPMPECAAVILHEEDLSIGRAVRARMSWSELRTADELVHIAALAASGLQLPDAEPLAIRALERALAGSCAKLDLAHEVVARIDADPRKQERFEPARARLRTMTPQSCAELTRRGR
jgi:hypothetical protein